MIQDQMRFALAITAVKYMGQDRPIPDLEFVMHPNKASDARLEFSENSSQLVLCLEGAMSFLGVPIREDVTQSTWTLSPVVKVDA